MLRPILSVVLSLLFCSLHAQDGSEKLKGLLWEISGHGLGRPGYLYGTMHVPEKLAFNLSDSFFVALGQSDIVALETDHDQWQAFTAMLEGHENELFGQGVFDLSGIRHATQADLYHDLFSFPTPENALLGAILSAKPRMTNEFLYRSNQYRQDYEEDTYLDLFIFQAGRKLGKKVIGLETMEGSYEAYVRAQMPDDEDDDEEDQRYYPGRFGGVSLDEAYRDQDLSLLDSLNKMMRPGKNFQRWMQDERNLLMAWQIDSILQSGTVLFSAVGAAHLPGEMGLIKMLREKGYALRPVQFSAQKSKLVKDSIDALRYSVQFSKQWAPDSTWSVEAPGKFYQTIEVQGLEQQLCADMGNGAYYAVYQIPTYGLWNGQSPDYIAGRIDSLIYEKIPGKIQERKRLTHPFPGHEITTRTRRGDVMRYKIFVGPMNVFLFATGGNGDYALGKEGSQFMNSIRFSTPLPGAAQQLFTVSPPQGGFSVRFPATPFLNTTGDKKAGRCLVAATEPADSAFYLLYRADFHDWQYIEEDSFELNIIGEKIAAGFTKQPPVVRQVTEKPFPVQDISFRSDRDSAFYFLRLVIDGPRYYLLGCRKWTDEAPLPFFESFTIAPFRYPEGWQELSDTTLMFRATAPVAAVEPAPPFVIKLRRIIEEGLLKSEMGNKTPELKTGINTRLLKLARQGEEVFLMSRELQKGQAMVVIDSFQTYSEAQLTNDHQLVLREAHWEHNGPQLLTGNFLLEDTNSTRAIRARMVVTPGRIYTLAATVQSGLPESEFVRTLFSSFTPTDTTTGAIPFGRRNWEYLQHFYATDSLVRERALGELLSEWQHFDSSDYPALRAAIEHPGFGKLRYNYRAALISALGHSRHAEVLQYLQGFFDRYPDSVRYRQTILKAMANIQSRPAFEALVQRLNREAVYLTPFVRGDLFHALKDTLELTAKIFRKILPLFEQQSYRDQVLDLIELLLYKKLIRPKEYARLIPVLRQETAILLSQLQLHEQSKGEDIQDSYSFEYGYFDGIYRNKYGKIEQRLRILAPFVRKDADINQLFRQATRSPEKTIQVTAWCYLQQYGTPVPPETLRPFADNDFTRIHLYRQMAEAGQMAAYSAWFKDTIALALSILVEEARDQIKEQDSIRFRSVHPAKRWNKPAVLYFFEIKKKKEEKWILASLRLSADAYTFGVGPAKTDLKEEYLKFRALPEVTVLPELSETEKEEFIQEKIGENRFVNRERYRVTRNSAWE